MIEFHDVYATNGASDILWALLVERSDTKKYNISHHTLPRRDEHEEFIASKPYWVWNLVSVDGKWVGSINITWRNEVGIMLFIAERGLGYGKMILRKLIEEIPPLAAKKSLRPGAFVANINPRNERSIRLFSECGFAHIQNTYRLFNGT